MKGIWQCCVAKYVKFVLQKKVILDDSDSDAEKSDAGVPSPVADAASDSMEMPVGNRAGVAVAFIHH